MPWPSSGGRMSGVTKVIKAATAIKEALQQLGRIVRALDAIAGSLDQIMWELKYRNTLKGPGQ